MTPIQERLAHLLNVDIWLAITLAVLLMALVVSQVTRVLFNQLLRWTRRSETVWDEALVESARRPMQLLIWIVALTWAATALQRHWPEPDFSPTIGLARNIGIVLTVAWFFWQFIGRASEHTIARGQAQDPAFDLTTALALSKLARLIVVVVATITVAQTLGFQIGGLLALGGVGGIAVGLAARDILANFFGGLTIYLDRPFSVGDWIRSPDKSLEGTVEYISWRHTRIRAFNKNPIYVPNSVFTNIVVENPSRMTHRRFTETIGVRYDDLAQVDAIVTEIRRYLSQHPAIDTRELLIVNFNRFGTSSLDIMIYAFTLQRVWAEFQSLKHEWLLAIGHIIERHGARVALPTQTLHVDTLPVPQEPAPT